MKVRAYLGPNKPQTVAVGEVELVGGVFPEYAVVKFPKLGTPAEQERGEFVGAWVHYGPAVSAVNRHTTHRHYAVLCCLLPLNAEDLPEYQAGTGRDTLEVAQ